jgi:hypothetical protein
VTTTEELPTLLDVNVLLALVWDHHIHHGSAHRHFRAVASDFATSPVTEIGLVRLLLTPSVTGRAVSPAEALGTLNALRTQPGWQCSPGAEVIDGRRRPGGVWLTPKGPVRRMCRAGPAAEMRRDQRRQPVILLSVGSSL